LHDQKALRGGLALGISALFSPVILVFVPLSAWWLRAPSRIALLMLGVAIPIVPVTARNYRHGGELVLISTNGGLNFAIGNDPEYPKLFSLRPGRHWQMLTTEPQRHGIEKPGAASSYFTKKTLRSMAEQPVHAVALFVRKLYLYFHGAEIPRDGDVRTSRLVLWHLPNGLLIPFAVLGMAACWRERRRLALLYLFVAAQVAVAALFFVTSRHRLPVLPALALFAAASWPTRARQLVALVGLLVVLNLPTREEELSFRAELDFYRGMAWLRERHDPQRAAEELRKAADRDPGDARFWFELGNALDAAGRSREAITAWQRAADTDPWDSRARRRASLQATKLGDLDGAIAELVTQVAGHREPAHYAPDWLNLAYLYTQKGDLPRAREALAAARRADESYVRQHAPRLDDKTRSALGIP
jgi:tetratricopeptide (TPR) repeat protein